MTMTITFAGRTYSRPTTHSRRVWRQPLRELGDRDYRKGYCRVTRPGYLRLECSSQTDEGYSSSMVCVDFDLGEMTVDSRGSDCDGSHYDSREYRWDGKRWVENRYR